MFPRIASHLTVFCVMTLPLPYEENKWMDKENEAYMIQHYSASKRKGLLQYVTICMNLEDTVKGNTPER